ncbi:MAG: 50S ribosomal protein L19 [Spiroplasma sp.]|nr:50S ribosomal protein L19 [Spiroplasma sp.]
MENQIMAKINQSQLNLNIPKFRTGDTVKITWVISNEKEKERLQVFQGIVISIKGSLINKNIIVRKGVKGKGVEKTFPLHSPLIKNIEVVATGQIRQAKPFYLRNLGTKALKKKIKANLNTKKN